MTGENRLANARGELAAADDALRVAEAALGLGITRDAMSRVYYAAFHAARALLLLEGYEPKTHGGLMSLFSEHLVVTGKLGSRYALLLTRLQAYRQASDYSYSFTASAEEVKTELEAARDFVAQARAHVSRASSSA